MSQNVSYIWVKVLKNESSNTQADSSKSYHFTFFKGCLPQILLGPFLNTLTHLYQASTSLIKFTKFWKTKCTPEAILCSKSNTSIWFCEADLCWILKRRKLRNGFIFRWNHYRKLWWIEVCCYFNFNFFL